MTYERNVARTTGWLLAAGMLCITGPAALLAQQDLTVERIYGSDEFDGQPVSINWMPDGRHWSTTDRDSLGRDELWQVEASTGRREKLVSAAELGREGSTDPLPIEGYTFSADGRRLLIFSESQQVWRARTKGRYYVFDFPTRRLIPVSGADGWQMFAKLSPDARQVAYVRDNDLYVTDLSSGEERRLTSDGSEEIINGTTDWVYEEELGLRDAFRWSPDGSRIAYWRFDQSPIRTYWLVDDLPLYPELTGVRYPKAGEANSTVRVGSVELTSGETSWFDIGDEADIYIARMEWAASSEEVVIQRLNRHQSQLDLLLGDATTGVTSLLFSERDEAWLNANDDLTWVDGGRAFTWTSDRDGFTHVYLYDRTGRMLRQLTRGNWDVTAFHGVDERAQRIFFTAASESPLTRSVYSAPLDGGDMTRIAGGRGTHSALFSPDYGLFTDTYSSIGTAARHTASPGGGRRRGAGPGRQCRVAAGDREPGSAGARVLHRRGGRRNSPERLDHQAARLRSGHELSVAPLRVRGTGKSDGAGRVGRQPVSVAPECSWATESWWRASTIVARGRAGASSPSRSTCDSVSSRPPISWRRSGSWATSRTWTPHASGSGAGATAGTWRS